MFLNIILFKLKIEKETINSKIKMLCFMLLATISIVHSFTLLPRNSTVCYGDLGD